MRDALVSFCLIVLCCAMALAQGGSTAGKINGRVADESGAVIPGAVITVKNTATNLMREAIALEDGSFAVLQVPPGSYELTARADGFNSHTVVLELGLGINTLVNFTLTIGASSEIIEVSARDTVNQERTESSTNIDRNRIANLPINRRNFLDFTLTSPRAVKDRVPAQGASASSGLSFNGQPARFNNITIDGLDNNEAATGSVRATFSQEAVQEFQVVSDSYSAEFGRALGGVVNIVTRGGGNEFHGNIFGIVRNDEISARDVFAPFEPDYKQYQFGVALSGPIKKDRAFFFTSFERLTIKQSNFVTISDATVAAARRQGFTLNNGPVPFSLANSALLARIDARLTSNDTLFFRYNYGGSYNGALEPFGSLIGETNGGIQLLDDNTFSVSNTYVSPTLNLINETRFLSGRRNQDIFQLEDGPQVRIFAPEGFVTFGRGTLLPQPREEQIYQIVNNVSLQRGINQIKFGADFSYVELPEKSTKLPIFAGGLALFVPLDFSLLAGIPGLPTLSGAQAFDPLLRTPAQRSFLQLLSALAPSMFPGFPSGLRLQDMALPFAFAQGFGRRDVELNQKQFALFFQDDLKISERLLIKAGLRYDVNRVSFVEDNSGNFSPRVAFALRPPKLDKLTVRAAYGVFFGAPLFGLSSVVQLTSATDSIKVPVLPFPFSVVPFSLPGRRFPEGESIPAGVNFIPQLSTIFTNDPKLRNSYTQQLTAGVDYQITGGTALSITYNYVRGIKLLSQRNINPVVRPVPGNPLASQVTGRRDPTRGEVFEFESAFDSYYNGVTFQVNGRLTDKISLLAHYTFSKAIDNFIDIRFDLQEAIDPLNPRQERGLSLQDVRSRFVVSGTWDINYGQNPFLKDYQLSTIVTLESGRPYNLLAGVDLNNNADNPPGDRPFFNGAPVGRNVGITPGFANVDLRLTRGISVGERVRAQLFFEIFNLFNRVNISEIDRIFPPDARGNFQLPRQEDGRFTITRDRFRNAFPPRQCQFGFRVNF